MGITILYSSGDNGVAGNDGFCLTPDGTQTATGKIFNPSFPGQYLDLDKGRCSRVCRHVPFHN